MELPQSIAPTGMETVGRISFMVENYNLLVQKCLELSKENEALKKAAEPKDG